MAKLVIVMMTLVRWLKTKRGGGGGDRGKRRRMRMKMTVMVVSRKTVIRSLLIAIAMVI